MKVETIKRDRDMIFGEKDLEPLFLLEKFPVYMGVSDEGQERDSFADEKWMISRGSGMIQLGELVPAEVLYAKSHNSSIGKVWQRHHEKFSEFLHRNKGEKGILEAGGGNGILNSFYSRAYGPVDWTIVEPSEVEVLPGCRAKYKKTFWKEPFDMSGIGGSFDTLVHSHLLEHQFDINEFMGLNASALPDGGAMVFSVPNMAELLARKYPYALNFEHTYYISEDYIERILPAYGFTIKEKSYFEDHSIFYATQKSGGKKDLREVLDKKTAEELYGKNRSMFMEYVDYYRRRAGQLNRVIAGHRGAAYVFGAHINTQMLISFGLNAENVKGVLDNDGSKQGHRLYGTDLRVMAPRVLEKEERPLVILIMGAYSNEIREDILENINGNVLFAE